MTHRPAGVAARREPTVDVVLVRVDHRPGGDADLDQRAERLLLDVGRHADDHLAGLPNRPEDRRLLRRQRPPPRRPLPLSAPAGPPSSLTASGWPCLPALLDAPSAPGLP